jgi:hypothetical protein
MTYLKDRNRENSPIREDEHNPHTTVNPRPRHKTKEFHSLNKAATQRITENEMGGTYSTNGR